MYEKLNITENHLRVLSLFTKGFNKEYYIREVHKLIKISPRTAQIILNDLENKSIIESRKRGKIKIYYLKNTNITEDYLILTEQYKKIVLLTKKPMLREILSRVSTYIKGVGVLFGSYARGFEKQDSDIDIFVIGECNRKYIREISKTYNKEINVKIYTPKVFMESLRKDILIKEILESHIAFLNPHAFVRMVLKNE